MGSFRLVGTPTRGIPVGEDTDQGGIPVGGDTDQGSFRLVGTPTRGNSDWWGHQPGDIPVGEDTDLGWDFLFFLLHPCWCILSADDGLAAEGNGPDDGRHILHVQGFDLIIEGMIEFLRIHF